MEALTANEKTAHGKHRGNLHQRLRHTHTHTHTHEGEIRKKKQKGIIIHVCFITASNDEDEQPSVIDISWKL